jgi:hypothetical protein
MHVNDLDLPKTKWLNVNEFYAEESLHEVVGRLFHIAIVAYTLLGGVLLRRFGICRQLQGFFVFIIMRKAMAIFAGYRAYDATRLDARPLCQAGDLAARNLREQGYIINKITLHKSGVAYSGAVCTHEQTINNGAWAIHALGVRSTWEQQLEPLCRRNHALGLNTLLVNGPSIGNSDGYPTRYQMGACYEAGLQYLERVVNASRILMYGYSFGGATLAEGIINHDFSRGQRLRVKYMFVSDRTFDNLQHIASKTVCRLLYPLFVALGVQLDGVAAARKLANLGIRHVIIQGQNESDEVIVDAVALAKAVKESSALLSNKCFLESPQITHRESLPEEIKNALEKEIAAFLSED